MTQDAEKSTAPCAICGEPVEWDAEPTPRHILADPLTGASQDDDHIPSTCDDPF